jgi:hypothetical protein
MHSLQRVTMHLPATLSDRSLLDTASERLVAEEDIVSMLLQQSMMFARDCQATAMSCFTFLTTFS